jgi:hypothetical protein
VRVSPDVVFDESRGWDWNKGGGSLAPVDEEFTVEHPILTTSPAPTTSQSPALGELGSTPVAATAPSTSQIELATPLEDDEDRLDAFYDDEPLRYHTVTIIIGNEFPQGLASRLFA